MHYRAINWLFANYDVIPREPSQLVLKGFEKYRQRVISGLDLDRRTQVRNFVERVGEGMQKYSRKDK